jgi:hypothetical protein
MTTITVESDQYSRFLCGLGRLSAPFKSWGDSRGAPWWTQAEQRAEARVGESEDSGLPFTSRVEKWMTPLAQVWRRVAGHTPLSQ